jgi:hypothetical protein
MERERVLLEVWVDLDPIPGTFHTKESARNVVANILETQIHHYQPLVSTTNKVNKYDDKS